MAGRQKAAATYRAEELEVMGWLRQHGLAQRSLKSLLLSRYWSRARLPLPESSAELGYRAAEQGELLAVISWLDDLASAPADAGSEET